MSHDLFVMQISIAEKILRTVLVYATIVVLFRLTGKRGLAGLNTLDFAVVFLLSNVVQNAIIGADNSVLGGIVGAVTLVVVNTAISRAIGRSALVSRVLQGHASTVITEGRVDEREMRRIGLGRAELEHAVRLQNGDSVHDVADGSLQPGGQLLLTLKESEQPATQADLAEMVRRLEAIEGLLRR